jgi:TRAP-type C4-dicarboxylate transport system permease small subunit
MKALLKKYDVFLRFIGTLELGIGFVCLVAIVICIFCQVVSRYAFGKPLVWVEEFSTYCFIWAVYLGAAYALIKGRHIRVTTLVDTFPAPVQRILALFTYGCLIFFLSVLIKNGLKQVAMEGPQRTIALPVKLPRKYFFSIPFVISCISMMITSLYVLLRDLYELLQHQPVEANHFLNESAKGVD